MNTNAYSIKGKNLIDVLVFIGAPVNDEHLVAMTLNGLGKDYSQHQTLIVVRATFPDFQKLITLFISEKMKIVGISSSGGSQEVKVEIEVVEFHLEVDMEVHMVDIINMKVSFMEVDEETLEEEEVLKVMLEIIKVNKQTMTQIGIIMIILGTW
jgi:hypothetical protein